jgi:hypothetical protein
VTTSSQSTELINVAF